MLPMLNISWTGTDHCPEVRGCAAKAGTKGWVLPLMMMIIWYGYKKDTYIYIYIKYTHTHIYIYIHIYTFACVHGRFSMRWDVQDLWLVPFLSWRGLRCTWDDDPVPRMPVECCVDIWYSMISTVQLTCSLFLGVNFVYICPPMLSDKLNKIIQNSYYHAILDFLGNSGYITYTLED